MKPNERRQNNAYPYFKLATWDDRSFTFKDGKVAFASPADAQAAASKPGKYRISVVDVDGRHDLPPFTV